MTKKNLYRLTGRDKTFIAIISTTVLAGFILVPIVISELEDPSEVESSEMDAYFGAIFVPCFFWFMMFMVVAGSQDLHVLRPDLMRYVFVIALLCSILGIAKLNFTLVSAALLSIFLFPFLDWLDISIKIPQSSTSALFFSILQIIVLSLVSLLIELIL